MVTATPEKQAELQAAEPESTVEDQKATPAKERPPILSGPAGLELNNLDDIFRMADWIANSDFAPPGFKGNVANCVVAIEYGKELGLQAMASIQNMAVIKGRPTVWGDAVPALCMKRTDLFDHSKYKCYFQGKEGTDDWTAVCECRRLGAEVTVRKFSVADAKRAGLWGKDNYKNYPGIMLTNRARTFALRHAFPDILKGLHTADEIDPDMAAERALNDIDMPATNASIRASMSTAPDARPSPTPPPAPVNETITNGAPPPDDGKASAAEIQCSELLAEWNELAKGVDQPTKVAALKAAGINGVLSVKKCTDPKALEKAIENLTAAT